MIKQSLESIDQRLQRIEDRLITLFEFKGNVERGAKLSAFWVALIVSLACAVAGYFV